MSRIICLILCISLQAAALPFERHHIRIIRPAPDTGIGQGPLTFAWSVVSTDSVQMPVSRYEVSFWSKWKRFRKLYSLSDSTFATRLHFDNPRSVFKRHGTYYWRVSAFDTDGNRLDSDIQTFFVPVPQMNQFLVGWLYPYDVKFKYVNRVPTAEYEDFLQGVKATSHLKSYCLAGLGFRQLPFRNKTFEFKEYVILTSQAGLGVQLMSRFRLWSNNYCAVFPAVSYQRQWFSTSLEYFSNTLQSYALGADFALMPRGFIVLRSRYIPGYQVRYQERTHTIRTFDGVGWLAGARFYIPRTILNMFEMLGVEFDFQRIPITLDVIQVHDDFSNIDMRMHTISIGYIFR